jgi:hypothetical protein
MTASRLFRCACNREVQAILQQRPIRQVRQQIVAPES